MPNYVTNRFILSGPAHEISRFQSTCIRRQRDDDSGEASLDFEAITPMPAEILAARGNKTDAVRARALEATGFADWYSWTLAHWGTKWHPSGFAVLNAGPKLLDLAFDTAWNSPEPIFQALAAQYPLLKGYALGMDPMMDWSLFSVLDHGTYASACLDAAELSFLINDCTYSPELSRLSAHTLVQEWTNIVSGNGPGGSALSRAASATAAVKAALPAEVVVKLEFATAYQTYEDSFLNGDADELDESMLVDLAFFTAQDRCRTDLDLRLLEELADTMRSEALSATCQDAGRADFSAHAAGMAERCSEDELHAWAALAMYRPGISLAMSKTGSLQVGFAAYGSRLYDEAVAYLKDRAAGLRMRASAVGVQGA